MEKGPDIAIQERDIQIIELLIEYGYLKTQHFVDLGLFNGYRAALRRLKKLNDAGIIRTYSRTNKTYCENLYGPLFKVNFNMIDKDLLLHLERVCYFKPWIHKNKIHEDTLRDWSIKIKKAFPQSSLEFDFLLHNNQNLSSNRSSHFGSNLPDLILHYDGTQSFNVEMELTLKSKSRYLEKLNNLMYESYKPTIYLTDKIEIKEMVLNTQRELEQKQNTKRRSWATGVHAFLFDELSTIDSLYHEFTCLLSKWGFHDLYDRRTEHGEGVKPSQENPITL